jgi:hypothetical protein
VFGFILKEVGSTQQYERSKLIPNRFKVESVCSGVVKLLKAEPNADNV